MIYSSSTTAVPEVGTVPRHVAIIMDGNGRWATKRFLPRVAGHVKGADAVRGVVETELAELGFEVTLAAGESHLCCGSAGTYSLLQPQLSKQLRNRKLGQLQLGKPQAIISANIGCIQQLQSGTTTPVRHWIELLDEALP